MNDTPEPQTRIVNMNKLGDALLDYTDPARRDALRLQLQSAGDDAESESRARGPAPLGPVHGRVRAGGHRHGAIRRRPAAGDDVCRELRHRQGLRADQPAARAAGRSNRPARRDRTRRSSPTSPTASASENAEEETDTLLRIAQRLPAGIGAGTDGAWRRHAAVRRPAGPVRRRVSADARREDRPVSGGARCARRPPGSTLSSPTLRPTSTRSRSFLRPARRRCRRCSASCASARACCRCTRRTPRHAGLATDDPVRVFNELGEVQCPVAVTTNVRPGTVSLSKGLWRKSTYNGSTSNALVARYADRPRRRRLLQRRAGAGRVAGAALTSLSASPQSQTTTSATGSPVVPAPVTGKACHRRAR